jgi:hypothetical protein
MLSGGEALALAYMWGIGQHYDETEPIKYLLLRTQDGLAWDAIEALARFAENVAIHYELRILAANRFKELTLQDVQGSPRLTSRLWRLVKALRAPIPAPQKPLPDQNKWQERQAVEKENTEAKKAAGENSAKVAAVATELAKQWELELQRRD